MLHTFFSTTPTPLFLHLILFFYSRLEIPYAGDSKTCYFDMREISRVEKTEKAFERRSVYESNSHIFNRNIGGLCCNTVYISYEVCRLSSNRYFRSRRWTLLIFRTIKRRGCGLPKEICNFKG